MDLATAQHLFRQIRSSQLAELRDSLVDVAVRYARMRVDWLLAESEQRASMEADRTRTHNALIAWCDTLARNMALNGEDTSWRRALGEDRKVIGDFACWIHCLLGLDAR